MNADEYAFDHPYARGLTGGFVATFVLSVIMAAKAGMGLMPQLDVIGMLTSMAGASTRSAGWIIHFVIGTILWGLAFGWLVRRLPGPTWWRGVIFATGAWLLMMIVLMPMAGAGFFGFEMGVIAPVATFVLHAIYGAVLGWVFGVVSFRARSSQPVKDRAFHP